MARCEYREARGGTPRAAGADPGAVSEPADQRAYGGPQ